MNRAITDAIGAALKISREEFEAFASMDAGELPADETNAMQIQISRWSRSVFGFSPTTHDLACFAGIVEELAETWDAEDCERAVEELVDVVANSGNLLLANRLALAPVLDLARVFASAGGECEPRRGIGGLARAVLKRDERRRGYDDDDFYRAALVEHVAMCIAQGIDNVEQMHEIRVRVAGVYHTIGAEMVKRTYAGDPTRISSRVRPFDPRVVEAERAEMKETASRQLTEATRALLEAEQLEGPGDFAIEHKATAASERMPFDPGGDV